MLSICGRESRCSRPKVARLAAASSQHLILPSEAAPLSLFFFTTFYPSQPNLASFSLGFVKSRRLRCLFFFVSVFVAAPSPSLYRLEILKSRFPPSDIKIYYKFAAYLSKLKEFVDECRWQTPREVPLGGLERRPRSPLCSPRKGMPPSVGRHEEEKRKYKPLISTTLCLK